MLEERPCNKIFKLGNGLNVWLDVRIHNVNIFLKLSWFCMLMVSHGIFFRVTSRIEQCFGCDVCLFGTCFLCVSG